MPKFRIEKVLELNGKVLALAAQIDGGTFTLKDNSTLGGVPVEPRLEQPRRVQAEGRPDLRTFTFQLKRAEDRGKLTEGQIVELC